LRGKRANSDRRRSRISVHCSSVLTAKTSLWTWEGITTAL